MSQGCKPTWVPRYGWDRYRFQSHPPKIHTHVLGLAGFSRHSDHQTSHVSHITTTLSNLHTTTDTTTHPGHEPEHNNAEVGRWEWAVMPIPIKGMFSNSNPLPP